ncbi:hypothetical protein LNP24_16615 [Klebsiella pneumoniae subsp. pneumoniae]|nr:hypothetical protein [Klebsiella pneumoniae subsp. pneumoniae]
MQSFVSRFSANASKSRQATCARARLTKSSWKRLKPPAVRNPFIRFEQDKKLFRNALEVEALYQRL